MNAIPARSAEFLKPAAEGELRWAGHMADDVAATFGPEPLAALAATSDMLVLHSTRGTFRLPRAAITRLRRAKLYPWFFNGIRIEHTVAGVPKTLQFKPLDCPWRQLLPPLHALGYPTV